MPLVLLKLKKEELKKRSQYFMDENGFGRKTMRSGLHKCSLCIYFISLLDSQSKINLK